MAQPAEKQIETSLPAEVVMTWYQITLSAIGDAVLTTDSEGRITYMNPVAEYLTGWVADEAHGQPLEEVFRIASEETGALVEQPVRRVIATGLVRGMANHTVLISRDGTVRSIADSAAPVRNASGELIGVVMVFRDVSEMRRKEHSIEHALAYADGILDTIRDPFVVLDADLRIRSASRSYYQVFDVKPGTIEGSLLYELGNGDWNIPHLRTMLEAVLESGEPFRDIEVDFACERSGRRRLLLNAQKVLRSGVEAELILLSIEDITTSWRSGVDFTDNRERYRVIVEAATGFAIFTFDSEGMITSWNRGAETMLGYGESEILGKNFQVIFTPDDVAIDEAGKEMRIARADGRALDERWHLKKNGDRFWAQGLVMPLQDDAGETRGFLKIIRDMTEQRQLEEALKKRTADLEVADVQKNEFLAMLAHELRNPLASIRNAVTLATHTGTREDLEWSRDVTARQVMNFAHLIDDLMDVARINQGKIRLRKEVIDVVPVVKFAVEAVRPLITSRKHELVVAFEVPDLKIEADSTRLEQMVVNLLSNAAKYTPEGGRIELTCGLEESNFVCRVRDNGVGIEPKLLPRIFDLFAQADGTLARSESGLGIGLTLVRSIAALHGGAVSATSDGPGKGSEFVLRLPVASTPHSSEHELLSSARQSSRRGQRVLVVDDNEDTANGMAKLLKLAGHEVAVAFNGADALASARQHCPEVVILDIGLPAMSGYEIAAQLRRERTSSQAVIIAVSGYGEGDARVLANEAGFDHHLVKPVNFETLLGVMASREPQP